MLTPDAPSLRDDDTVEILAVCLEDHRDPEFAGTVGAPATRSDRGHPRQHQAAGSERWPHPLRLAYARALAAATDRKARYSQGHSRHVARHAVTLGRALGLDADALADLEVAGYLHDVGKMTIAEGILNKPSRLSADERRAIRTHPAAGASMVAPLGFPRGVVEAITHHHEWWDGRGYPAGLQGHSIPLAARILSVADAFETMTAGRPYQHAMSLGDAAAELRRMAGTQFDPRATTRFLALMEGSRGVHEVA